MRHISIFSLLFFPLFLPSQTTWHVNATAPKGGDGRSWAGAFSDLHEALGRASAGDAVWVAKGLYVPDTATNRNRPFVLKSGVRLHGGFVGVEKDLSERQPGRETVLSGNIGNKSDSTDNAYTILYMAFPDSSTLVEGLSFEHGYAVSDTSFNNNSPVRSGGAVFVLGTNGVALPTFRNCHFRHNVAAGFGGALCLRAVRPVASAVLFQRCTFVNNRCGRFGGAVYLSGGSPVDRGIEFDHCIFRNNYSYEEAGGVYLDRSVGRDVADFKGCVSVANNSAKMAGFLFLKLSDSTRFVGIRIDSSDFSGARCDVCAAVCASDLFVEDDSTTSPVYVITNSTVHDNYSGSLVALRGNPQPYIATISNNIFRDNFLIFGVSWGFGRPLTYGYFQNNLIQNNRRKPGKFGAEFISSSPKADISYNTYTHNGLPFFGTSPVRGTVTTSYRIHHNLLVANTIPKDSISPFPYLIFSYYSIFNGYYAIDNNLFLNNRVDDPAIPVFYSQSVGRCSNNIFINNTKGPNKVKTLPLPLGTDSLYLRNNLMDLPCSNIGEYSVCGPGNIFSTDPLFTDTASGNYRPTPCSPVLNAGYFEPLFTAGIFEDFDGNYRFQEGVLDIGPYEIAAFGPQTPPVVAPACKGQTNGKARFSMNGCPPYRLLWPNNRTEGEEIAGLAPGQYDVTVQDGKNRLSLVSIEVPEAVPPVAVLSGDTLTCPGFNDGTLGANVTTAYPPVTYAWSNGASTVAIADLPPGAYALTTSDALGCRDTVRATVKDAPAFSLQANIQDASAPNRPDGSISVSVVAGAGPFSFRWDNGATTAVISNIPPGKYQVTVIDGAGCGYVYAYEVKFSSSTDDGTSGASSAGVWPNPASGTVLVRFGNFEHWQLYSPLGHLVLERSSVGDAAAAVPVDLGGLPQGAYAYRFLGKGAQRGGVLRVVERR